MHAESTSGSTDWAQSAVLYGLLEVYEPGPVVRLGRAVVLGRAHGPEVGLRQLEMLSEDEVLARFRPFHIAHALTLEELDDHIGPAAAYRRALDLLGNNAESEFIANALSGVEIPE